jgi:hypothetical protein
MGDLEMKELPAQFSMPSSSPLAQSGYELVAADGGDERAEWSVVGDDSQLLLAVLSPGQVSTNPARPTQPVSNALKEEHVWCGADCFLMH